MDQDRQHYAADVHEFGELLSEMIRSFAAFERIEIFRSGVTMSQCSTILAIGKKGPMTMNALSEWMSLATSTTTRIVDHLVRDGYIERSQDPRDRRVVRVSLTEEGQKLFQAIKEIYHEYHRKIVKCIRAEELREVVASLTLLIEAMKKTPLLGYSEARVSAEKENAYGGIGKRSLTTDSFYDRDC
jgi:DNA-binding MarR family transcriptional regulator